MAGPFNHVDVVASSRAMVDVVASWATDLESDPREYDYSPGYYAVFFYDPDHLKREVVHQP